MISYQGLEERLAQRGIGRSDLVKEVGLSSRTVAKIAKKQYLSKRTLQRIAEYLGCEPTELCREISGNALLQALRDEKEAGISGGIYHELQVRMAYNSNHIEGSKLTEEQTRLIFETKTIDTGGYIPVDDILETVHHFRAVDHIIDVAEEPLDEPLIKHLHYMLKHDTKDALLPWFAVGDYKRRANVVGGRATTRPAEVHKAMAELLASYNAKPEIALEDIVEFHAVFERIHPFQDGNGRVGRLIALKECLRFGITPFIIEDSKKAFYYRGLSEWNHERGYLLGTCLDGQDTFARLLDLLEISHGEVYRTPDRLE